MGQKRRIGHRILEGQQPKQSSVLIWEYFSAHQWTSIYGIQGSSEKDPKYLQKNRWKEWDNQKPLKGPAAGNFTWEDRVGFGTTADF